MAKYDEIPQKNLFWENVPEKNSIPRNRALLDRDLKMISKLNQSEKAFRPFKRSPGLN